MNDLRTFYKKVKDFCADHNMINEFILLNSESDLESRELEYRTFIMIPSSANISRDLARPIYTLSFNCAVLDKCSTKNESASIISIEENLFVIGQLQDFLIQEDENCYIDEVEVENFISEDENVTSAYFDITMSFARKGYKVAIDNA